MILDILENRHIIKAVKYSYDNLNLRKDDVIYGRTGSYRQTKKRRKSRMQRVS